MILKELSRKKYYSVFNRRDQEELRFVKCRLGYRCEILLYIDEANKLFLLQQTRPLLEQGLGYRRNRKN